MPIRRECPWNLPDREATPESVFLNRRALLAGGAALGAGLLAAGGTAQAQGISSWFGGSRTLYGAPEEDPSHKLYPVERNPKYTLDREVTAEEHNLTYNNFYEFGSRKTIAKAAQQLKIRPWTVTFDGMVEEERTVDIDTLLAAMPLEERLYRLRCVEAWSMAVPWSGFALSELVTYAKPLSGARYVRFETFLDPEMAPGQTTGSFGYPWPYVEGVTMAEAMNELSFMVTGAYGKPLPKQMGSPLRLALPWKYGFKSIKSIVRVTFTDERPVSFWEQIQPSEYGFWANVNPEVPHRRWSQATEQVLGTDERVPTRLYNGYAEYVADLYKDMDGEPLFM